MDGHLLRGLALQGVQGLRESPQDPEKREAGYQHPDTPCLTYHNPGHRTRDSPNTSSTFDQEAPILKSAQKNKPTQEAGTEQQPSALLSEDRCPTHTFVLVAPSTSDVKWGQQGRAVP